MKIELDNLQRGSFVGIEEIEPVEKWIFDDAKLSNFQKKQLENLRNEMNPPNVFVRVLIGALSIFKKKELISQNEYKKVKRIESNLRMKNLTRTASVVSYLLIILAGQMIGLPFFLWLISTTFDFGNIDQIFAILGIIGIGLNLTKWRNNIPITIISFLLMLSPIISRLAQTPITKFNYLAFQIPLVLFITLYLIFIALNIKEQLRATRTI